jgi:hypothetical protein
VDNVGEGLCHVVARFGFLEIPNLRQALARTRGFAERIDFDKALFFGGVQTKKRQHARLALGLVRVSVSQFGKNCRSIQSGARECDRDCQAN